MGRIFPRMHQHDRAGDDAVGACFREGRARRILVERLDLVAVDADAPADLDGALVEHRREPDREVEQARPGLVADAERVREAAIDDEERALPLALEQRVRRDRRPHLHGVDGAGRDRRVRRDAEHGPDPGDRGVAIAAGILGEQLVGGERPGGAAGHDIGEGAAAIDREPPAGCHGLRLRQATRAIKPPRAPP
jgi:hypothetical protein